MERAAKYAYKVYLKKSFSAAAKELYISQPSLSSTIGHLEEQLGFRIFDRSASPVTLTYEGKIYIEYLEEIMESERTMKRRITQLSDLTYERLSVGGSNFLAHHLFPLICGEFHRRYPKTHMLIDMGGIGPSNNLYDKLDQQTLDLLLTYDYDPNKYHSIDLLEERIIIAMRRDLPGAEDLTDFAITREELLRKTFAPQKQLEDFSLLKNIGFFALGMSGSIYHHMSDFTDQYTLSQYRINNARNFSIRYDMMLAGLGAAIITDSLIAAKPTAKAEILYFVFKSPKTYRKLSIIYKNNVPLSQIAKRFIDIATKISSSKDLIFPEQTM